MTDLLQDNGIPGDEPDLAFLNDPIIGGDPPAETPEPVVDASTAPVDQPHETDALNEPVPDDIEALKKRIADQQQFISRQSNEIGTLRKQVPQQAVVPEVPSVDEEPILPGVDPLAYYKPDNIQAIAAQMGKDPNEVYQNLAISTVGQVEPLRPLVRTFLKGVPTGTVSEAEMLDVMRAHNVSPVTFANADTDTQQAAMKQAAGVVMFEKASRGAVIPKPQVPVIPPRDPQTAVRPSAAPAASIESDPRFAELVREQIQWEKGDRAKAEQFVKDNWKELV
jgi:hypothetical protein